MITLGKKYKDKITGFEGIATGNVKYITGCNQALLAPPVGNDGGLRDPQWIDEQRLVEQEGDAVVVNNTLATGCDRAAPKR